MSKSTPTPARETKAAILRKLLSRKAGADLAALQAAQADGYMGALLRVWRPDREGRGVGRMTAKHQRVGRRDFIYEDDLFSLEDPRSVKARKCAIEKLGEIPMQKRERADEQLSIAIYEFVLSAVEEAAPPPSQVRDRLQKIAKQAKKLDELITGERGDEPTLIPVPAIQFALMRPTARETGETEFGGLTVDGVTYIDDAPVTNSIAAIRNLECWACASLTRYGDQVRKRSGGRQTGKSKSSYLMALNEIYFEATGREPTITADPCDGGAVGQFAEFADAAIEALLRSFKPDFDMTAPKIHKSMINLADSRKALFQALRRSRKTGEPNF